MDNEAGTAPPAGAGGGTGPAGIALVFEARAAADAEPTATITLDFEQRSHSRLRVTLDSGEAAAIVLPRGQILRGGDKLVSRCGRVAGIVAAAEPVTTALADDSLTLARGCYHLGNRHLPLQIGDGWVRYRQDHVIDELACRLGLHVRRGMHPFEPEHGAYAHGGHAHAHDH